jgi:two-component system sensor histidine kinase LytS
VALTGRLEGGALCVTVADDGAGIPPAVLPRVLEPGYGKGLGIALPNVQDRLKGFFGPESGLSIESTEGRGTSVHLVISPLPKRDPSAATAPESEPARA